MLKKFMFLQNYLLYLYKTLNFTELIHHTISICALLFYTGTASINDNIYRTRDIKQRTNTNKYAYKIKYRILVEQMEALVTNSKRYDEF